LIIYGQQAIYYQDEKEKNFTCWELHSMGRKLGAGSMQDGAYLISRMYEKQKEMRRRKIGGVVGKERKLSWDEIFEDSPLFMM
jgi:hypothetical protein